MQLLLAVLLFGLPAADLDATDLRLTYTTQIDRQDDLYLHDLATDEVSRITSHRAKDSHGVPSPDGRRVAFSSERNGWWKIWVAAADGSDARQLTFPASGADYHPDWSPDGRKIVFVRGAEGNGDVMMMDADGGGVTNLSGHSAQDNFPTWSPDGAWIAFASDRDGGWAVYVMRPDGGDVRRLPDAREALEPSWWPDSQRVVYQAMADDSFDLFSVALDGSADPMRLTDMPGDEKRPEVSPDGKWIAFESDRDGGSHIYVMPAAGGEARQLTTRGFNYAPHWWPR